MATSDVLSREEKVRLLQAMFRMTDNGIINWRDISEGDDPVTRTQVFVAEFGDDFEFAISSIDDDGVSPFEVEIFKDIIDGPVAVIQMRPRDEDGDEEVNGRISALRNLVLRRVGRSDEIIRELFQRIDRIENKISDGRQDSDL